MKLRQLKFLLAIDEAGTLTAAAEKLFVSQSALSQQIKSLENELGSPLFDRSRNRLQLTQAGALLLRRAKRILNEVDETITAIDELESLPRGHLKIGVLQTVNAYLIPQAVASFSNSYPNVSLEIEELSAFEVERKVYEHDLDVGISFMPNEYPQLDFTPFLQEGLLFIVHPDHPMATQKKIKVNQLEDVSLILLSNSYHTREIWNETADKANIYPNISIEMNTIGGILATLQRNPKIGTILPELTMQMKSSQHLVPIPLDKPAPQRTVGFVWRNSGYRSKAAQEFAKILKNQYEASEN